MALAGVIVSSIFLLNVLMNGIPLFLLGICE
jgi:hypothetical protein